MDPKLLEKIAHKELDSPVRKNLFEPIDQTQTKDLGEGVVEVIVSTNNEDRHLEILDIKSLDVSKYNGIVLLNHQYGALPIGKSILLKKRTKDGVQQLISQTQFAIKEYPLAETVYKLVVGGYMPDVSIGFIGREYKYNADTDEFTWINCEMIEYSHVTVGANPDAKVTKKALGEIGVTEEQFDGQVRSFMQKSFENQAKSFETLLAEPGGTDSLLAGAKAIKEAAAALEATLTPSTDPAPSKSAEATTHVRRVKLVTARKQAQAVDRLVEGVISGLKEAIK